jgi:Flp pilus assembly CpaF family ATPase
MSEVHPNSIDDASTATDLEVEREQSIAVARAEGQRKREQEMLRLKPLEASAVRMFFQSLAPIKHCLDGDDVSEVMVNTYEHIFVEQRGKIERLDVKLNPGMLEGAIRALATSVQKSARAGTQQGIVNAGHQNLRIAAVMMPTAIDGHALSIRKHHDKHMALGDYVRFGAFSSSVARNDDIELPIFTGGEQDDKLAEALSMMIRSRKNVLVAGGTSAGKTTFLNALCREIPEDQRVITIEDTQELKLVVPNLVRLLSNADKDVTTQLLVKLCLRFRPDRIIVGEVRGAEAFDFVQALSTGHDGGLGSIHANDCRGALYRLESLAMLGIPPGSGWSLSAMRKSIADCFNYVVHFRRTGGQRHVSEIVEIKGYKDDDYILQRHF